jgi:hypothetical protein
MLYRKLQIPDLDLSEHFLIFFSLYYGHSTVHTNVLDLDPNPFNLDLKIKKWAYTLLPAQKALNKNRLLLSNLSLGSQHA